ncbi:ArsR/SmtB family transcription factor [Alkaliphilus peptidifermentans]|uniref:DNA-binding transcriptional regulator, ArsR family n=1 Tax=Alkaliphilus peptidifermentans DSM 18978 TaxID=1120976 RepID=A0A1G5HAA0_9FIRM|nr:metalloregulator ArsR/SmtB family transcription factor [Alkaliphilus peptidifermentans]SCY60805.1 DNA-binding transcriptional regulator, ArsR family [Alkaliphilus peptidifermentans DSM 18978]
MASDFELRVINKPIYYVELIALLNRIINSRNYRDFEFSKRQNSFLDMLKGLRVGGCELFEFFLYDEGMDDISYIEEVFQSYTKVDFLYLLCGEVFTKERIKLIIDDFDIIHEIVKENKFLSDHDWEHLRLAFENTDEFIRQLIDILNVLNKEAIKTIANTDIYEERIAKVHNDLKTKVPLNVAQDIMGKKFKRVFDFTTYYFVPSYFYINKPMRTFNKETQMVVYPIDEINYYNKNSLANALKIIGDNTRLEIIQKLSVKAMFGKEIAKEIGIGTSTVSHHLEQLRSIGLIHEERDKNIKYFSLNIKEYNHLCDVLKDFIVQD